MMRRGKSERTHSLCGDEPVGRSVVAVLFHAVALVPFKGSAVDPCIFRNRRVESGFKDPDERRLKVENLAKAVRAAKDMDFCYAEPV